ncbi:MAG: DUF2092 domain-containing protein [Halioglobus sp.]|nr:DUF2092 domain-containing protein [Halioglobus sp.]
MRKVRQLLVALMASCVMAASVAQTEEPEIDPATMEALDKMGVYLRSLQAFRVLVTTTNDTVLEDGQKLQYEGTVDVLAKIPDGLRIHTLNDRHERLYFFDGKTFTLWGQRVDYYATVDAPPTIRELGDALEDNYGLMLPAIDLFRWGTDDVDTSAIISAMDVGSAIIDGTTCEHYAFRQKDIDWQLWVQKGDYPLPRKLVITTKTDDARPQYSATYKWDLAPSFNDAAFEFRPPNGALRVLLEDSLSDDNADGEED